MEKTVAESSAKHVEILFYQHLNGYTRLFGGKLMEWIDIVAAVVARRHSDRQVTTVRVDNLVFEEPAKLNDLLSVEGRITYVGRTSMEVRVDTFVESYGGARKKINTAYVVMVAIDENERPTEVPRLKLVTDEEREEWNRAVARKELRKAKPGV